MIEEQDVYLFERLNGEERQMAWKMISAFTVASDDEVFLEYIPDPPVPAPTSL
jgi:hypothetical protein